MVEEILKEAIPIDKPFEYKGKLIQTYEISISLSIKWAESCKYCCFNHNGICKFLSHPYRYFYKELIVMERKIGEIFEFKKEWYQCVEGRCKDCHFSEKRFLCKQFITKGFCNSNIIFKKLEKVGEPFEFFVKNRGIILLQKYKMLVEPHINGVFCNIHYEDNTIDIELKQNKEDMGDLDKIKVRDYTKVEELNVMEEKKLNLKPFDIQKAREGKPVCTRDGHKARIICFDKKCFDEQILIVLVDFGKEESIHFYTTDGKCIDDFRSFDLMMLPEKKEGWAKVRKDINLYDTKEEADRKMIGNDEYVTAKVCWEE